MAAYSQFLGCKVTVRYRVGEVLLSATGTFSADSGRSIFLEQHVDQRGTRKYFRWEIPYPYIHRIKAENGDAVGQGARGDAPDNDAARLQLEGRPGEVSGEARQKAAAAAAGATSDGGTAFRSLLDAPRPLD